MAKYQVPQWPGDIVMIQSEHTGAVDILSADLESADLLGDHRKGETFGSVESGFSVPNRYLKAGRQMEGKKVTCERKSKKPGERMCLAVTTSLSKMPGGAVFPLGFSVVSCLFFQSRHL